MFTIIGGDGKEYGPASAEQIRSWIAAGRANLETRAKTAGSDEWRRLGDYPEFSNDVPPPLPGTLAAPTAFAIAPEALAGRGTRLLGRVIDWVAEMICCIPGLLLLGPEFIQVIAGAMRGEQPDPEQFNMARLALGFAVLFGGWLLLLVIQVILLSTRSQSIGKIITGTRIVRLDGSKPGFVYAWLLREALVTFAGVVLSLLPFIGPFLLRPAFHLTDWCLIFRDDRRCLHDLIASTQVVKA